MPTGIHSDFQSFCSNIIFAIVQNRRSEAPEDRKRRMVLRFDNATPHTSKCTSDYLEVNWLTLRPHPASSPDLAPSDCHLFGKLKMALMRAVLPGHWKLGRSNCWHPIILNSEKIWPSLFSVRITDFSTQSMSIEWTGFHFVFKVSFTPFEFSLSLLFVKSSSKSVSDIVLGRLCRDSISLLFSDSFVQKRAKWCLRLNVIAQRIEETTYKYANPREREEEKESIENLEFIGQQNTRCPPHALTLY
jgi:hypothetical protein